MRSSFWQRIFIAITFIYFVGVGAANGYFWQNEETLLHHVQNIEKKEFSVSAEQIAMRFSDDEKKVKQLYGHASTSSTRSLWLKRLGNIYHKQGKHSEAIKVFGEAIKLNPSNIEALNELGVVFLETAQPEKGFLSLQQSLKIDPYAADTYRLLGIAYYRYSDFSGAISSLRQALDYDPDQEEVSLYLMMAYFFTADKKAYLDALERVTHHFVEDRVVLKFAAQEFFNHGYFQETVNVLSSAKSLFADDPQVLMLLRAAEQRVSLSPGHKSGNSAEDMLYSQ